MAFVALVVAPSFEVMAIMLTNRWAVLALLFAVRTGMGLQFQAVPALSPLYLQSFPITVADLGLLIGLYHAPGLALAMPGGAIGRRFGEKSMVLLGLGLMIAGGLVMATTVTWIMQIAGRLLAGIGGILLTVIMSKMVTDWFADKELATAMGLFANSWPVGIAVGLVTLPLIATRAGFGVALLVVVGVLAIGLLAMAMLYQPPPPQPGADSAALTTTASAWPRGAALAAVLTAGAIWGLYNAGLGVIFGFGPLMLAERGWSVAAASGMTSIVLWLMALSVPLGGVVADWSGRFTAVLVGSFAAFALALVVASRVESVLPAFIVLGAVSGLAAGPIMSLPARALTPATRAVGMGLFFTMFFAAQMAGPWFAGIVARAAGTARATFDMGAALLVTCIVAYVLFLRLAARPAN